MAARAARKARPTTASGTAAGGGVLKVAARAARGARPASASGTAAGVGVLRMAARAARKALPTCAPGTAAGGLALPRAEGGQVATLGLSRPSPTMGRTNPCLICPESVRPAFHGGGGGGLLKRRACAPAPLHARCIAVAGGGADGGCATQCPTCGRDSVEPWCHVARPALGAGYCNRPGGGGRAL